VAPFNLRSGLEALIRREIENARQGPKAYVIFKVNAVVDRFFTELLYEASQAGVKVDLLVRSMCCLRPGVKGVSENIRVVSIVGRYLEHSRVYYFHNGGKEEIYIGSADLMSRIDHRVEVVFPIEDEDNIHYIRDTMLDTYLKDNVRSRVMRADGTYTRPKPSGDGHVVDVQEFFMNSSRRKNSKSPGLSPIHP
jgi:polyphosphate kinase